MHPTQFEFPSNVLTNSCILTRLRSSCWSLNTSDWGFLHSHFVKLSVLLLRPINWSTFLQHKSINYEKVLIIHVHTCKTSKLEQRIPCKFLAIFNKCLTPLTLTLVAFIFANLRLEAQGFSFCNVPKRLITPWSVTFDEPVTLTSCKVKGKIL